ncbi:VOC family protein [Nocardia amamiensis]|uniref:VOC family protein n=1 Tax=Nocardia amamiensis TaxID=404578 RepID=UPI000A7D43D4|nr:VOC family protein [Nocardia amamiensis]
MTISQIRTITALVEDQDRAKRFYTEVLGFTVRGVPVMGTNRWLAVAPGESEWPSCCTNRFQARPAGR